MQEAMQVEFVESSLDATVRGASGACGASGCQTDQ